MPLVNELIDIKNAVAGQHKIHIAEAEIYATGTSSQWGSAKGSLGNMKASHSRAPMGNENGDVELPSEIKEVPAEQENTAEKAAASEDKYKVPPDPVENTNQNNSATLKINLSA